MTKLYFLDDITLYDCDAEYWVYYINSHYKRKINCSMAIFLSKYHIENNIENNVLTIGHDMNLSQDIVYSTIKKLIGVLFTCEFTSHQMHVYLHSKTDQLKLNRLFIEVTNACNLRCKHCYLGKTTADCISFDSFKNILDKFKFTNFHRIDITGGEPFKNKDLQKILEYCTHRGYLINIFTNGTLISEDVVSWLSKCSIQHVYISLDSAIPEKHDYVRGKTGSFEATVSAIKKLRKHSIPVVLNSTLFNEDLSELELLVNFSKKLDVSLRVCPVLKVGNGADLDVVSDNTVINALIKTYADEIQVDKSKEYNGPLCGAGSSMIYIRANGDVCICPTLSKLQSPELNLGNIYIDSTKVIAHKFNQLNICKKIQCEKINCEHYAYCGGGCRSRALINEGTLTAPDYLSCKLFEKLRSNY